MAPPTDTAHRGLAPERMVLSSNGPSCSTRALDGAVGVNAVFHANDTKFQSCTIYDESTRLLMQGKLSQCGAQPYPASLTTCATPGTARGSYLKQFLLGPFTSTGGYGATQG